MSYLFAAFVAFKVKRSFRAAEWGQTRATRFLSCQDIGYLGACSHSMEILGMFTFYGDIRHVHILCLWRY